MVTCCVDSINGITCCIRQLSRLAPICGQINMSTNSKACASSLKNNSGAASSYLTAFNVGRSAWASQAFHNNVSLAARLHGSLNTVSHIRKEKASRMCSQERIRRGANETLNSPHEWCATQWKLVFTNCFWFCLDPFSAAFNC